MVWRKDGSQEGPAFYTLCPFQAANGFQILHPYAIGLTWPVWSMSTYDPMNGLAVTGPWPEWRYWLLWK